MPNVDVNDPFKLFACKEAGTGLDSAIPSVILHHVFFQLDSVAYWKAEPESLLSSESRQLVVVPGLGQALVLTGSIT